jgi:hypothetical protein
MIFCSQFKCWKELILFCIYFHFPPSRRNEYQVKQFLRHMIKSWFWSWLAPPRHQLGKFHRVAWSCQAAMILRMGTRPFWKGLHIKVLMLLKGSSIFEIHSNWTQACLIYIIWPIIRPKGKFYEILTLMCYSCCKKLQCKKLTADCFNTILNNSLRIHIMEVTVHTVIKILQSSFMAITKWLL